MITSDKEGDEMKGRWLDILVSIVWVLLGIFVIFMDVTSRPYITVGGMTFLGLIMIVYGIVPAKEE